MWFGRSPLAAVDPAFLSHKCDRGVHGWSAWPVSGRACTMDALNGCALVCTWCVPSVGAQHWSLPFSGCSFPVFTLLAMHHFHCLPMCILIVCLLCLLMFVFHLVGRVFGGQWNLPTLAFASIQVAWLHFGSTATLRPAETASPKDAPALALPHTLHLCTPCRCSYCCAVITSLFFTIVSSLYVYYFSLVLFALCLWVWVMYILRTATWGPWICPPGHPHLHCLGLVWCRLFSVCAAWADPCLGSRGDPWQLVCKVCKAVSMFPVGPVEQGIFCCS